MDYNKSFINIELSENTIYVYSVRKLLQKALDKSLSRFKGQLVDLGCGEMPYRQYILDHNKKITKYIGIDIDFNQFHQSVKPDIFWDGKKIPLKDNSINTIIATELFEHIPNLPDIFLEIKRVLTKDGMLYFTIPFIWPLHETPYDEYRYTPYSLTRLLTAAGFKKIQIQPLGYTHASLAQMLCIWCAQTQNSFSGKNKNKVFEIVERLFIFPIIDKLIKLDNQSENTSYQENTMAPGFYGYATK